MQSSTNNALTNATTKSSTTTTTTTMGHDRQPSVQLKIEACGGPPNQRTPRKMFQVFVRNSKFIVSQIGVLVSNSSPIVQTLCVLLVLLYVVQMSGDTSVREFLVLSPGSLLSPGQWWKSLLSAVTHPLVEFHWYQIVVDVVSLSLCGTLIEPLWGQKEVIFFLMLISLSVSFLTCIHYIIIYTISTDATLIFSTEIHGLAAFCAAISVTVKQLLPQSILITTAFGRLKNDHIPITSLLLAIIAYCLNLIEGESVVMFVYGLIVSWIYLRYFQPHVTRHNANSANARQLTRNRGDLSDSFAFVTFFPNVVRPIVAIFADALYHLFTRIGVCPDINAINANNPNYRLLSERLATTTTTNTTATHDLHHNNNANHLSRVETL